MSGCEMYDQDPHAYTPAGRGLLLVAVLLPVVGFCGTFYALTQAEGVRRVPAFLLAVPYMILATLLFHFGTRWMRAGGIRVRYDDDERRDGSFQTKNASHDTPASELSLPEMRSAYCSVCDKEVDIDDEDRCVHCHWTV
ncbi:MAG: hypothetical protein ACR2NZ_05470 [Rubripirellula sp.]